MDRKLKKLCTTGDDIASYIADVLAEIIRQVIIYDIGYPLLFIIYIVIFIYWYMIKLPTTKLIRVFKHDTA